MVSRPRTRTLDELEGVTTGPPTYGSYLVQTYHKLRTKPVGEFTTEDLRIMIGQQDGLMFLVPLALDVLEENPMAEGDFYPGDLLGSVLRADPEFWRRNADWRSRLERIVSGMSEIPEEIAGYLTEWRKWQT
ncbi:MAG: contact-dependent growth inhibition system immunity protein [Planctomycetota bacterium]